jgi:serine/threonine protein kinase
MATVYLCTDTHSGNKVAVKVLKAEVGGAVSVERFLREITFSSQLDHPQIPRVLGSGVSGQLPFCVMTYIEGESLRSRLDRVKQLTFDEAVRITREVVAPMAYAHSMGIIHRDIKPANIILGKDRVYVLDFGVARAIAASADESLTSTGIAVGTPAYMSPEQALAQDDLDERSDIFSLACVTYEMIAGTAPFHGATAQAVMARRFVAPPPPLSEVREFVPPAVESAISKALCKAPADRWQSISEFGDALTTSPSHPSVQATQLLLASRKRKFGLAIAAVALIAVGVTGVVAWSLVDRDVVAKARRSIDEWNSTTAETQLGKTISTQGETPEAQLWLAQAKILRGAPIEEWSPLALKAHDHKAELKGLDTARAAALAAYADEDSPNRCGPLRSLAASRDPLHPDDYTAQVTLADCLSSDPTVVEDKSSRTGYRFASSYQEAVRLYEGLLQRNATNGPAYSLLIPRLSRVLWTTKNKLRGGVMRGDTERNFISAPGLSGDTIVFEPQLIGGNGAPFTTDVERLDRFVVRNLEKQRKYSADWARTSPADPDAQETLSGVLESVGKIGGDASAIQAIRAARAAGPSASKTEGERFYQRLRLASTETRLLLKLGQFARARVLAESASVWKEPASLNDTISSNIDGLRTGLFAVTGKLAKKIEIAEKYRDAYDVRLPSGEIRKLPAEIGSDVLRLASYTAFGGPKDSIIALDSRIRSNLESVVPSSQIDGFRGAVLRRPLTLSLDVTGPKPVASLGPSSDPFITAVRAVDAGQLREARKLADSLAAFRSGTAAGEITMDVVFQEAWLHMAIGDNAGAMQSLDRALNGLSRAPANLLDGSEMATALVRAMMMRATLAAKAGDEATRRKWAGAARELWRDADPEVKQIVAATVGNN